MALKWTYSFPPIVPGRCDAEVIASMTHPHLIEAGRAALAERVHAAWVAGDLVAVMDLVGNEERPGIVFEWYAIGVDAESLASCVLDAWSSGHRHHGQVPPEEWLELFDFVGFVSNPPRDCPDSVEVWRGQPVGAAVGMCWSTDRNVAEWFRRRWDDRGVPAELLHAVVTGWDVLAMDDSRNECEVVVDIRGLGERWVLTR